MGTVPKNVFEGYITESHFEDVKARKKLEYIQGGHLIHGIFLE
jgi:hypothetical protein